MNRYKNPHESKHTMAEVLKWFDETGFEFINSIPKMKAFEKFKDNERLFKPQPRGSRFDRFAAQMNLCFKGIRKGAEFVMIGRKKF